MDKLDEIRLMITIAELYYTEKRTQQEIAEQIGVSRSKVSRYLKECEDNGIVKITITNPLHTFQQAQDTLKNKYNLKDVIIVPAPHEGDSIVTQKNVARTAARYLQQIIRNGDIVGIQWGHTAYNIMKEMEQTNLTDVTLVQIQGNSYVSPHDSNEIAFGFAKMFNTIPFILPAPNRVTNIQIKKDLLQEPRIKELFEYINNADVIMFTVGSIGPNNRFHKEFYENDEEIDSMIEKGAVGDICGQCIDIYGNICDKSQADKIISIELDVLKQSKMPVLVAGGEEKYRAIIGALNAGYCKVLITDEYTANLINRFKPE
jgi:deoxyribonucleoside regulator